MTKEEIIRQYEPHPNKAEVSVIGKMMDEYAKQQILAFSAWTDEEGLYQCGDNIWKTLKPECNTEWNHEEIYNQFIEQQQNKDNGD